MELKLLSIFLIGLVILVGNVNAFEDSREFATYRESDEDSSSGEKGLRYRSKRQVPIYHPSVSSAMDKSLTRNPVGKIEFGKPSVRDGYFGDKKNFGGVVGSSAGVKVWESRGRSVGVGLSGEGATGLYRGRPYFGNPRVGAAVGYRRGNFEASLGASRGFRNQFERKPSTYYGAGITYRWRRDVNEDDVKGIPVDENVDKQDVIQDNKDVFDYDNADDIREHVNVVKELRKRN